jgi:hypothetical protein
MMKHVTTVLFLLASMGVAPADPAQDCAKLTGDDGIYEYDAIRARDEAIGQNPRDVASSLHRARRYLTERDSDHALADTRGAIQLAPGRVEACIGRADGCVRKRDADRALADDEGTHGAAFA